MPTSKTNPTEEAPNPELIFQTLNAHHNTAALRAAIELDVFTAIAEGAQHKGWSSATAEARTDNWGKRELNRESSKGSRNGHRGVNPQGLPPPEIIGRQREAKRQRTRRCAPLMLIYVACSTL